VSVTLKSTPADAFFSNKGGPDSANYFYYDVAMFTSGTDPDPTPFLSSNWGSSNVSQKENSWNGPNVQRYQDSGFDQIITNLKKETDQAKRDQLAIQANDYLIQHAVVVPLVHRFLTQAKAKSLKGAAGNGWETELWNIADWTQTK
jgi:peptide/nickel transport system substrate-binding protein